MYNISTNNYKAISSVTDNAANLLGATEKYIVFKGDKSRDYNVGGPTTYDVQGMYMYNLSTNAYKAITMGDTSAKFSAANTDFAVFSTTTLRSYSGLDVGATVNNSGLVLYDVATNAYKLINHDASSASSTSLFWSRPAVQYVASSDQFVIFSTAQARAHGKEGVQFGGASAGATEALIAYDVATGEQRLITHTLNDSMAAVGGGFSAVSYGKANFSIDLSTVTGSTLGAGTGVVSLSEEIGVVGSQVTAPPSVTGGTGLTLGITVADKAVMVGGTTTLTFTFNEAVTDFALSKLTVTGGQLSNLQTSDNTVFTATFTADKEDKFSSPLTEDGTWFYFSSNDASLFGNGTAFADAAKSTPDLIASRLKVLDLKTSSDNGVNAYDNVTSLKDITVNAMAKPSQNVELFDLFGGKVISLGTATTADNGQVDFSLTNQEVGSHQYYLADVTSGKPIGYYTNSADMLNVVIAA